MWLFSKKETTDREKKDRSVRNVVTGETISQSVADSSAQAKAKYAKPETYRSNRHLFDDGKAKEQIKKEAFQKTVVKDPYTDEALELTIKEAKLKYGNQWKEHLAEADHVLPLERVHELLKDKPWLATEDVKDIANHTDNLEVISRKINNAKRSRTNEELMNDQDYLESKDIFLSEESKQKAMKHGRDAERGVLHKSKKTGARNALHTGHKAGCDAAFAAGTAGATISGIQNIVAVLKGEKDPEEALLDVGATTVSSAATGYAVSSTMTTFNQTFSNSDSKFLKALTNSKFQGVAITAVMTTGATLSRWCNDEITTQECILDLGEKGLCATTAGTSMAIGQALIPIPIVGAAIGAIVGSTLTSAYCQNIIGFLQQNQVEEEERRALIREHQEATRQLKLFHAELNQYLDSHFREYQDCFDFAMSDIQRGIASGDALSVISGANQITRKLGGTVHYDTIEEFSDFFDNEETDEF